MTNSVSEQAGKLLIRLEGDIDLEHSSGVRQLLLDSVTQGKDVLVDLASVTYIDSSGVASLVEALQSAKKHGNGLGLVSVSTRALRVLELARLDQVFTIHSDLATALGAEA